jgi:hypothetical protein
LRSTFAYNPSTQGAITSIDVSYDLQEFAPLGGFEVVYGILAFQNNTYYIGPTENLNQSNWTSFSHHGLTEASFSDTFGASGPLGPGPATPDFAATGGAIEFGFFSGNTPIGDPSIRPVVSITCPSRSIAFLSLRPAASSASVWEGLPFYAGDYVSRNADTVRLP